MIKVTLPDGSVREFEQGIFAMDVVKSISEGLARAALCVEVDGEARDLYSVLDKDCSFKVLTFNDEKGKEVFWHSSSHVLAQAVSRIWPQAKFAIGPAIKDGFYYDIDFPSPITVEDLPK